MCEKREEITQDFGISYGRSREMKENCFAKDIGLFIFLSVGQNRNFYPLTIHGTKIIPGRGQDRTQ